MFREAGNFGRGSHAFDGGEVGRDGGEQRINFFVGHVELWRLFRFWRWVDLLATAAGFRGRRHRRRCRCCCRRRRRGGSCGCGTSVGGIFLKLFQLDIGYINNRRWD